MSRMSRASIGRTGTRGAAGAPSAVSSRSRYSSTGLNAPYTVGRNGPGLSVCADMAPSSLSVDRGSPPVVGRAEQGRIHHRDTEDTEKRKNQESGELFISLFL